MRFKVIALESLAIFACYLVFSLSLASATDVSIMYNGQVQDTAKYEQENLVNMLITLDREQNDITWTNVRLAVNLNSASLANTIKKIYLYKCMSQTPTECVRSTPQVFDNYVDTELLWKDISEKSGAAQYPQVANLLFIVKLEDTNRKTSWISFFTQTKRTNYNIFDTTQLSLGGMEVYAKSLYLVEPIKAYIESKMMIPFMWVSRVVFTDASPLYGIGASGSEADSHSFQTAVVPSSEITSINKDFYFVAPKISSGIANPIVLNLNPSFTCGNGVCESDIGESSRSCCYDCGCATGEYCDTAANINLSSCKSGDMGLSIISASTDLISDCSKGFNANVAVRVSNPPESVTKVSGSVKLNNSLYTVTCSGSSGSYDCTVPITSAIRCGGGSYTIGPGLLNLTIAYKDGQNAATRVLSTSFSGVAVNYDCKCKEGSYCDNVKRTCQSENAITLGITKITSYLDNYNPGDRIQLTAKVFNPPAGLVLVDRSATMNLTLGQVSPGTPECSAPNSQFEYDCTIPFQIAGYSNTNAYTFNPNMLYFSITYDDGPLAKTKTISAPFGPVSIPSRLCGDGQCNMDESQESCCLDCGCPSGTQYCDKVSGCREQSSVSLSVSSVYPTNFTDCREAHPVQLLVDVNNAPSDMSLDYSAYLQNGVLKGWNLNCNPYSVSMLNCTLLIPALEGEGCSLPYKTVGANSLNMTISFPNGKSKQITKHLSAPFQDILVIPVYHCGDGTCESSLGESPANCCYDCACKDSPSYGTGYYCDFDPESYLGGCLAKENISLVIDSPTTPVYFSSCELSNTVNIKAHIENQPKNAKPQHFYAELNGSAAEMLRCDKELDFEGSNYTFNCTLVVPKLSQCSEGQNYVYEPNSLSVLISYKNGNQKTEAQTLTSALPTITTRQGVRTLYDITQQGIAKMKASLQKTMDIAREMLDAFKSCMETVKMLAYMSMIAAVAGGIYSAATSKAATTSEKIQEGVNTATKINSFGTKIMEAYQKMCQYLQTQYQMDLEVQKMETRMIEVEMCMEQSQHMLDVGQCDKNPASCFSTMQSCVDDGISGIEKSAKNMAGIISESGTILGEMSDAINDAADELSGITGGVEANIIIRWGRTGTEYSAGANNVNDICDKSGKSGTSCADTKIKFVTSSTITGCSASRLMVYSEKTMDKVGLNSAVPYGNLLREGTNTLILFCDKDGDGYDKSEKVTEFKITLVADSGSPNCDCNGLAQSSQGGSGEISVTYPTGEVTIEKEYTISGTAPAGATVRVTVDTKNFGTEAHVDNSGKWEASKTWAVEGISGEEAGICAQYTTDGGSTWSDDACVTVKKKLSDSVTGIPVGKVDEVPNTEGGSAKCVQCPYGYKMIKWSDNDAVSDLTANCKPGKTAFCLDDFLLVCSTSFGWDATVYDSNSDCKSACNTYSECLTNVQLSTSESQTVSGTVISAAEDTTYSNENACKLECTKKFKSNCQTPIDCVRFGCCTDYVMSNGEHTMKCNEVSGDAYKGYEAVKDACCFNDAGFECINEGYKEWCPGYP
jgi:hypothetical protein